MMDSSPPAAGSGPAGRRATVIDVARAAAVSTATVDRVLNGRPGVRPATVERVLAAAAGLGYLEPGDLRAQMAAPLRQVAYLLPDGGNRYISRLGHLVGQQAPWFDRVRLRPQVQFVRAFDPGALARAIRRQARSADAIAVMAIENPLVREAIAAAVAAGVPVVTLISDIAGTGRAAYFGLDNRAAGRMAGDLLARLMTRRPARVAMIAGSLSYRAHGEREMGFLDVLQERHPQIEVVGLREGHDEEATNQRQMRNLLARHPDLAGIYNIGGGATGIARALRDMRRAGDLVFVGHGLTTDTRRLLIEGRMDAVITQSAEETIRRSATVMADLLAARPPAFGQETMQIDVIFRENLPGPMS